MLALAVAAALFSGCGVNDQPNEGVALNATPCQVIGLGGEVKDLAVYEAHLTSGLRDDVVQ
ncbi:MAG: hypothetical protein ACREJ2_16515, partial [Planctomycetota bacterium]